MNKKKELAKNTIIISIGKICTQLITFLLLPLYTSVLSTKEYGIVDLIATLVTLLVPIITLQLEQGLFRELIEVREDKEKTSKILSSGINCMLLQIVIFLLVFTVVSFFIKNEYKYLLAIDVVVYIISSIFLQVARGIGSNDKYAFGSFLCAFSTIAFNILFLVVFKFGVYGMLYGTILGYVFCACYLFLSIKIYKYYSFRKAENNVIKKILKYTIPLVPNAISWWVFNASDRLIVSTILGLSFTGLLSAALKFSNIVTAAYNVFHISWVESISLHIKDKDISEFFNSTFNVILSFFVSIIIGIIGFMPFAFPILINNKFAFSYNLIPIAMIAAIFHIIVSLETAVYYGYKDSKSIANTAVVSAIINVIVHLVLIKIIGLYAAVTSTFVAYFIMSMYRTRDVGKKYFKICFDRKKVILTFFTMLVIVILYYINNIYLNIISCFITIVYIVLMNKKTFKSLLKILKKEGQ